MPHGTPLVQVVGLDHVVFKCADVEKSLAFYCDALGLEPERVDEWRRGDVLFPSVRITPTTIIDLFGRDFAGAPDGTNVDHVCLVIEPADLDALAARVPRRATGRRVVRRAGVCVEPLRPRPRRQHHRAEVLRE